jgi:CDP-4-dehydro-6-deoxyglucose reductase
MAYTVTVRPSGRSFTAEGDETVLAAALRVGVLLPYGCKNGACGTCKGKVLEGRIDQGPHAQSALPPAEQAASGALFCCARATSDLVIEVRVLDGAGEIPVRKMPARIARIERVAPDVALVHLQLPATERLQYRAGQYLEFILKDGSRRSYSIANPPHDEGPLELHIRHMPGGLFTDALFGAAGSAPSIKERDIVRFEGPQGTFYLHEDDPRPIVLLASGTGFAPLKAIAEHLFHRRRGSADPAASQPVTLYWGCRVHSDLYLDELPRRWAREEPAFAYVPVLSEPLVQDAWAGRVGFVHRAVMEDLPDLSGHQVYACGAPAMVEAARRDFIERCGLPAARFHADAFTSQADLAR